MRSFVLIMVVLAVVSIAGISQNGPPKTGQEKSSTETTQDQRCSDNPDAVYDRKKILEQLAEILNVSAFGTRKDEFEFYVKNERPRKFTIFDLTDTLNKGTPLSDCIKFKNNHVYHFAAIQKRHSFSHIVILEDGNLKVFRSINCKGKGNSLEDVISYLNQKLKDDKDKQSILSRVKNYRKYGIYTTVDTPNLECKGRFQQKESQS